MQKKALVIINQHTAKPKLRCDLLALLDRAQRQRFDDLDLERFDDRAAAHTPSIHLSRQVAAALLIALLGFVSSAAMAKFLLRGEVIEP